ncbi:MAG: tetratricopeptide repeat protein [Bacteroidetes bacterium]|nr:tetratricopeptide repeat protein [Bacteroidota bacterium]
MKIFKLIIFLGLGIGCFTTKAKVEFNSNINSAFEDIYKLKLPQADIIIEQEIKSSKDNAAVYYLKSLCEIVKVFINENEKDYKKLSTNIKQNLKLIDKKAVKSPYGKFFKGQLLFFFGITQFKFEDYFSAGSNIREAYILLKENNKKYPDFLPNNTILGVIQTFSGTMPGYYKWLVTLFGIEPSVKEGMKTIKKISEAKLTETSEWQKFKLEARIFEGGLYNYVLHDELKAWNILDKCTEDWKINLFSSYLRASFLIKINKNEEAIEVLSNRPKGKDYVNLEFCNYLLGVSKLSRLDENADYYLKEYITKFKGRNYIKSALQKLSWHYLINGEYEKYKYYNAKINKMGYNFTDEDKQAQKSASSSYIPNISLLRSRLLCDGGYLERALKELENKSVKNFSETRDKIEFNYRLGRIYQKMGKNDFAIMHYKIVIDEGQNLPHYFATSACIETATIYELLKDTENAKKYYKKALTFTKNKEYENSLEQRAKAGLVRVDK